MGGSFEYSSFFKDKKKTTLGEMQLFFGFLKLSDIRNVIDKILAFEGVTQSINKSSDIVFLTPQRVQKILQGIEKWQSSQERDIVKRSIKNGSLENKLTTPNINEVVIPPGYISIRSAQNKYSKGSVLDYIKIRLNTSHAKIFAGEYYLLEESLMQFMSNHSDKIKKREKKANPKKITPDFIFTRYKNYLDR